MAYPYKGGRYVYKKYQKDADGSRVAYPCPRWDNPQLQSTYFINPDRSYVLRFIRIDVDADKTLPIWKNEKGEVDWFKVADELRANFPNIARQIEYVIRSISGLGFHILIGLASLPLEESTYKAQLLAYSIQVDLIKILNELGIGADPAGRSLKQDFSTFRNDENVIHSNPILTKRIELSAKKFGSKTREPFLTNLRRACDDALKKLDIVDGYRLYPDMRLEPKIAKLFLYVLGMFQDKDLNIQSENKLFYAVANSVELTLDEIAKIMGTEKRNIYKQFWEKEEIKKLFYVEKTDCGLRITVRDSKHILKKIQRAFAIWNYTPVDFNLMLIPPEQVCDGNRNTAIVSWVLALKWHGVAQEIALLLVSELVKRIPNYELSSSCKKSQIKATINSIYCNKKETYAIMLGQELPEWLDVSNVVLLEKRAKKSTTISSSRSIQGCEEEALVIPLASFSGVQDQDTVMVNDSDSVSKLFFANSELEAISLNNEGLSNKNNSPVQNPKEETSFPQFKILVVTYKQRVGFFYNDELILCMIKNKHYKLSHALKYLEEKVFKIKFGLDIKLDIIKNFVHVKHNAKCYKQLAEKLYQDSVLTFKAQTICGDKKSFSEKMEEYEEKKAKEEGIPLSEYRKRFSMHNYSYRASSAAVAVDMDIPF